MFRATFLGLLICGHLFCGFAYGAGGPKVIAEGDWSEPVTDNRGFAVRGRLVMAEKPRDGERREAALYVEFQDASDHVGGSMQLFCDLGKTNFRPEYKGGLTCEMHDKDKKAIPATGYPFSGAVPGSDWILLPSDATIRLRVSPFGIHRAGALAIAADAGKLWVIDNDDRREYFLSGTFTVDPAEDRNPPSDEHVWRGTLVLPPMKIVSQRR